MKSSPWMARQRWLVSAYRLLLPAVSNAGMASSPSPPRAEQPQPAGAAVWSGQTASQEEAAKAELSEPLIQQDEPEPAAVSLPSAAAASIVTGDSVRGILAYYRRFLRRLALYSYNTVTLVSLAAFRTVDVGEYGSRVRQSPTVSTTSGKYKAMATLFVFMLVVVVAGGPIATTAYLTRCYVKGTVGRGEQKAADGEADSAAASGAQPSSSIVLVLTSSFKPRYWWYPTVILLRRLLLLLMLTFIQTGLYSWLTVANNAFLTLHLLLWPYVRAADPALELLTAIALATQCTVLSAYPSSHRGRAGRAVCCSCCSPCRWRWAWPLGCGCVAARAVGAVAGGAACGGGHSQPRLLPSSGLSTTTS
jgi:hypothetical protein